MLDEVEVLAAKIAVRPEGASTSTIGDVAKHIKELLGKIKEEGIFSDSAKGYDPIEDLVGAAFQVPRNFADYREISTIRAHFVRLMQEAIVRCAEAQEAQEAEEEKKSGKSQDDRKKKIAGIKDSKESLEMLNCLVCAAIDQNRLAFIQSVLVCPGEIKQIFFSNLLLTAENIHGHYKELACQFHPDKAKWLPVEHRSAAHELMVLINNCKDALLQNLASVAAASGELAFYQKEGDNFWRMAMDYRYAQKGEWHKLTMFGQEDLAGLSDDVLNTSRMENTVRAYEAYRACCRVADKNQYLQSQIQLRESIALCLYAAGRHLDAQLYALAAISLINNKAQHLTPEDLSQAKKILYKVQGGVSERDDVQTTSGSTSTSQALVSLGGSSSALTTVQEEYSFTDRKKIEGAIKEDLSKLAEKLMLKSDRSLVKYQAAQEDILRAETKAMRSKGAGVGTITAGLAVGGIGTINAIGSVVANIGLIQAGAVTGLALAGPIVGIFASTVALGLGVWGGRTLWQKGHTMMKEPKIRKNLNEIMRQSLACYDQGNLQGFFDELSKKYDQDTRLLSLEGLISSGVNIDTIIATLTDHGFRPDGIAYLLNLVGEALSSGKVSIPGRTPEELKKRAQDIFEGALNSKLEESAKNLDRRISEMRSKNIASDLKRRWNDIMDHLLLRDEGYLAKEHVADAQEMPFAVRLTEMCNVAKMNIAIMRIVRGSQAEIHEAQKLIKVVRDSIDYYGQFHGRPAMRLAAIEDFLWIVSGQPADNEATTLTITTAAHQTPATEAVDELYLDYLNNMLEAANSDRDKAAIYNKRAAHYVNKAQEAAEVDHLGSLQYWQAAQEDYASTLNLINHDDKTASLGYARCLIGLSNYGQALRYVEQHPSLLEKPEAWIIASAAHRKQCHYTKAKECILEALQLDPQNQEAVREKALIAELISQDSKETH